MANNSALTAFVKQMVEERKESKKQLTDLGVEAAKIQMKGAVEQAQGQQKFGQDVALKQMEQKGQERRTRMEQAGQTYRAFKGMKSREKIAAMTAGAKQQATKSTIDSITSIGSLLDEFEARNNENASRGKPEEEFMDVVDSKLSGVFPTGQASMDDIRDYIADLYQNAKQPDADYISEKLGGWFPELFAKQGGTMGAQPRPAETGKGAKAGTPGEIKKVGRFQIKQKS